MTVAVVPVWAGIDSLGRLHSLALTTSVLSGSVDAIPDKQQQQTMTMNM